MHILGKSIIRTLGFYFAGRQFIKYDITDSIGPFDNLAFRDNSKIMQGKDLNHPVLASSEGAGEGEAFALYLLPVGTRVQSQQYTKSFSRAIK